MHLSYRRAALSSAASTSLPGHSSPSWHFCASPSGPGADPLAPPPATSSTSGSFITPAMPSTIAPVTVILAGSSLYAGASNGGNHYLNYEPDVSGRLGTQKGEGYRERISEGEGKLCSHFLSFICSWSFLTYCASESTLGTDGLASPVSYSAAEAQSAAAELDGRQGGSRRSWRRTMRRLVFSLQSKMFHFFHNQARGLENRPYHIT